MTTTDIRIHPDALELAEILGHPTIWEKLREHNARTAVFLNDGEGDGGGSGDGGGGEGGSGDGGTGDGDGDGSGDGGSGDGGDGGGESKKIEVDEGEWNNAQRKIRELGDDLEKRKKADAERERKQAEDEGRFKDVAETEKKRADTLEGELQAERRTNRGHRIAGRLNFRDTGDAIALLPDREVLDDDSKAEKALKDLAKQKPHLIIDGEKAKQKGDLGGDGGGKDGADVGGPSRMARAYSSGG